MNLKRRAFETTRLEEEREEGTEVISVRLNSADREQLNSMKDMLKQNNDAFVMRIALRIGFNVIHGQFGGAVCGALFKNKRLR